MGKLLDKLLLYRIQVIMAKELTNPYYKNAGNVREDIDLGTERIDSQTNKYTYTDHVKTMFIYNNGYVQFNDFIRSMSALPEVPRVVNQKVKSVSN